MRTSESDSNHTLISSNILIRSNKNCVSQSRLPETRTINRSIAGANRSQWLNESNMRSGWTALITCCNHTKSNRIARANELRFSLLLLNTIGKITMDCPPLRHKHNAGIIQPNDDNCIYRTVSGIHIHGSHLNNLRSVFEMCRKNNLKPNPDKCNFFQIWSKFLGHNCTF